MARPREFDIDEALDAAMELFWQQGYECTSMADLMEATGLHKGSIYKAFRDKHDLFRQALQRYLSAAYANLQCRLQSAKTPREGVRDLLLPVARCSDGDHGHKGCFAINAAVELSHQDEEIAQMLKRHFCRVDKLIADQIAAGQKAGQFRTDLPPEQLAEAVSVYMAGMMARIKCPLAKSRARRMAESCLHLISS